MEIVRAARQTYVEVVDRQRWAGVIGEPAQLLQRHQVASCVKTTLSPIEAGRPPSRPVDRFLQPVGLESSPSSSPASPGRSSATWLPSASTMSFWRPSSASCIDRRVRSSTDGQSAGSHHRFAQERRLRRPFYTASLHALRNLQAALARWSATNVQCSSSQKGPWPSAHSYFLNLFVSVRQRTDGALRRLVCRSACQSAADRQAALLAGCCRVFFAGVQVALAPPLPHPPECAASTPWRRSRRPASSTGATSAVAGSAPTRGPSESTSRRVRGCPLARSPPRPSSDTPPAG